MQIKLGDKIRELRKRDGRTQEDLANALGVTAQAVSRWEANGGYPDMSMIPAIANYFHITIDSLFGYNNDREMKIKDYVKKGNRLIIDGSDSSVDECIKLMRKGLEEFPAEPDMQMCLAHALHVKGLGMSENPNMYYKESAAILEELSKHNVNAILPLLDMYSLMGEYDKAEKRAMEQPTIYVSREVLLASIYNGPNEERYRGEAVLSLLHELRDALENAIGRNEKLKSSKEGIELLLAVRDLYEKILGKECYGRFHSDICMLYLSCVRIAANIKDYDMALEFFDSAYEHYTKFTELQGEDCFEDDHFDTPLLSAVGNTNIYVVMCKAEHLEASVALLPEEVKAQIMNNPKYIGL